MVLKIALAIALLSLVGCIAGTLLWLIEKYFGEDDINV